MQFGRVLVISTLIGLISVPLGLECAKAETPVSTACPAYVATLRLARTHLERGDRGEAVAALRSAQEALATCIREGAGETALAAVFRFLIASQA